CCGDVCAGVSALGSDSGAASLGAGSSGPCAGSTVVPLRAAGAPCWLGAACSGAAPCVGGGVAWSGTVPVAGAGVVGAGVGAGTDWVSPPLGCCQACATCNPPESATASRPAIIRFRISTKFIGEPPNG